MDKFSKKIKELNVDVFIMDSLFLKSKRLNKLLKTRERLSKTVKLILQNLYIDFQISFSEIISLTFSFKSSLYFLNA